MKIHGGEIRGKILKNKLYFRSLISIYIQL